MPTLKSNVLYNGRILQQGTQLSAASAKKLGAHCFEEEPKKAAKASEKADEKPSDEDSADEKE